MSKVGNSVMQRALPMVHPRIRLIWNWLSRPHSSIQRPELRRRAQLLSSVLLVLLSAAVASAPLAFLLHGELFVQQISLAGSLGFGIAYGISRTNHFRLATTLMLTILMIAVLLSAIGLRRAQILDFLVFVILLGSLFLSPLATAGVTFCVAAAILGLPLSIPIFRPGELIATSFQLILTGALATVVARRQLQYVHQIEQKARDLAAQNLELLDTQTALSANQAQLSNILQNAAEAIIAMDADQTIILFNTGAETIFGYSANEVLGQPLDFLLPGPFAESHRGHVHAYGAHHLPGRRGAHRTVVAGRRKDSTEFPAEVGISTYGEGRGMVFTAVLVDISGRLQHMREMEAIAAVSTALRRAETRASMLPIVLDQLSTLLRAAGSGIALRDLETGDTLLELGRGAWQAGSSDPQPKNAQLTELVIASGKMYWNNQAGDEPQAAQLELPRGIQSVAAVPLIAQEQTFGALWIGKSVPITSAEINLLTAVADMASNAIYRATLHEQTQRQLERLTVLRAIDLGISSSLDLRLTLDVLLREITTRLRLDAAAILLINPYAPILEYVAGRGFRTQAITRSSVRVGEGLAGLAALERRVVHVATLAADEPALAQSLRVQGDKFVAYFGAPLIADGQVIGVLEVFQRTPLDPNAEWLAFMEGLASQAAIGIEKARYHDSLQRSNTELAIAYDATIEGWSRALDLRDHETEGHSQRVTELAVHLARAFGMDEQQLVHVRRGALLHDIGKMGIPDQILLKPGPLTEREWEIMRQHPVYAYRLLAPIPYLQGALDIPYCHHEKWDGSGYPRGLKGDTIPLAARIFAVVDVWDALTSDRPYRAAWPIARVRDHICGEAGKHFDPRVVMAFLREVCAESPSEEMALAEST